MSKESGFVPIDEANTDNIRFAIDLPPYLDRTKIKANPRRIETMMRIGGISHLRVETTEDEGESSYPEIVGFDSQGNAYAGKSTSKIKMQEFETDIDGNALFSSPQADLSVKLNINQASSLVAARDARSLKEWGDLLNNAISQGIRKTGDKVLIWENIKFDSAHLLVNGGFQLYNNMDGFDLGSSLDFYLAYKCVFYGMKGIPFFRKGDYRISLFMGPQLDRLAILQAKTRLQKIVIGDKK